MKTLSTLLENFEKNPGNDIKRGVTNHLTPLNNIITNVRNLFSSYGIVVEPCDDGVSLQIHSSKFINPNETSKVLNMPYLGNTTLKQYIESQGLTNSKCINLGSYCVAYFGPADIATAEVPVPVQTSVDSTLPCTESTHQDYEMFSLSEAVIDDDELEDKTKEQLLKFIDGTDKVKCANKLAELLADDLQLPSDYYFKGVKDSDGNESIALRYKYTKRRPFGNKLELSKSLLNIYKSGKDAVWVEAFLTKNYNSDEMNNIVNTVLTLIGATPTDDPCVWSIEPSAIKDLKADIEDNKVEDDNEDLDKHDDDTVSPSLKDNEEGLKKQF